jgi:hypothetical protein
MVSTPVQSPDSYPAAFYNLGKIFQDMLVAFAKAKAAVGATTASEIEAAVAACVPSLVVELSQVAELGPDFAAAPIGCLQAVLNPLLDGLKAVVNKQ